LKPPPSQGTIWAGSVRQASNAGARFSGLDQFPADSFYIKNFEDGAFLRFPNPISIEGEEK